MAKKKNKLLKKKHKNTNLTKSSNNNLVIVYYIKEISLLILSAISIFFLIAFISYHPFDPGWSKTAQHVKISNIAGNLGAWFADLFFYFFGITSYLFPIIILYNCIKIMLNKNIDNNLILLSIKTFGLFITILSISSLISLLCSYKIVKTKIVMPISLGGIIGDSLSSYLFGYANFGGALLILLSCTLMGITAVSGTSWRTVVSLIYYSIKKLLLKSISGSKIAYCFIMNKISEANKKRGAVKKDNFKNSNIINMNTSKTPIDSDNYNNALEQQKKSESTNKQYAIAKNFVKQIKSNKISIANNKYAHKITDNSLPSINLLEASVENTKYYSENSENLPNPEHIQNKLADFGIVAKITNIFPGPVVTRLELELAPGTKASKITGLSKDLARSLSVTAVRVVEVIPGKSVIGLEIPNTNRLLVRLRDILSSEQYLTSNSPLTLALGKDIAGLPIVADLSRMPHLLVAGTTGSGKSVGVNVMLLSILFKATPDEVRLILIDPKMLELSIYDGIPHLLTPVVTDMKDAAYVLNWCIFEMERRYKLMSHVGVRNLLSFNHKVQFANKAGSPIAHPFYNQAAPLDAQNRQYLEKLPYIVVIIDEFADMMMVVGKKIEEQIARIAQKARAAGIHMILATQRPSVDVITGLIKANIPTRIAFQVSSRIDSRTILDQQGAEQLLGNGDLLYLPPGSGVPVRIHGAFVSDDEVHKVVAALKSNCESKATDVVINMKNIKDLPDLTNQVNDSGSGEDDKLYDQAVAIVTSSKKASISYLQRRLKIGFNRAANLIEEMQRQGIVSDTQHNGIREVLVNAPPGEDYA